MLNNERLSCGVGSVSAAVNRRRGLEAAAAAAITRSGGKVAISWCDRNL